MAEYHIIMRISGLFALFLLLLPNALAEGLPDLGDAAQLSVTPQTERRVGESIMRDIRLHDPAFSDDPEITEYLNAIGYRLVSNSRMRARISSSFWSRTARSTPSPCRAVTSACIPA